MQILKSRRDQLILIFLIVLSFITYSNTLQNGFAWDDKDFLLNWPEIKGTKELPAYLSLPYLLEGDVPLNHRGVYRPVRSVFYLVSYNFFGENPYYYHIQSIILHTLIVIVLYFLTLELIKSVTPTLSDNSGRLFSLIVSSLFATHPIHTESVSYITASFDNLGILFFFLSFYLYLRKKVFASVIYGFLAIFTYEMTLILPFVILLYEFIAGNFSVKNVLFRINSYKNFIDLLIVYILTRFVILRIGNRADYLGPIWQIAANQVRISIPEIVAGYLFWLAIPVNLTISHTVPIKLLEVFVNTLVKIDPSGNLILFSDKISFTFPVLYASLIILLAFLMLRKFPILFFGFSWIIICLLPVSNIIPQGASLAERFLYIPSYGFVLILGFLIYSGFKYLPQFSLFLFFLIISFYSYQTIDRNFDWKNEITIWESAVKVDPTNSLALRALAAAYVRHNRLDEGIEFYKKAIDVNVPSAQLHSDLGLAYRNKGDTKEAIKEQLIALEINSLFQPAYMILGDLYLQGKRFDLAEEKYKKALEIKKDPQVLLSLGNFYFEREDFNKALDSYRQGFELSPNLSSTSYNIAYQIGITYMKQLKYDEAIKVFEKSLTLNPKQPEVEEELNKAEECLLKISSAKVNTC